MAMDSLLVSTLTKLALPAAAIVVVLFATKRRGVSWQDDLGLKRPRPAMLAGWFGLWLVWIVIRNDARSDHK